MQYFAVKLHRRYYAWEKDFYNPLFVKRFEILLVGMDSRM